ncbi:MAG: SEC-C domain-containing protein [Nitrososphaera sp.]|nr:SEC-C domain-containing protein [Nitrososphaera sp.]
MSDHMEDLNSPVPTPLGGPEPDNPDDSLIPEEPLAFEHPEDHVNAKTGPTEWKMNAPEDLTPIPGIRPVLPRLRKEDGTKLGRNDKCPCNSGRKFKHCCMSLVNEDEKTQPAIDPVELSAMNELIDSAEASEQRDEPCDCEKCDPSAVSEREQYGIVNEIAGDLRAEMTREADMGGDDDYEEVM